MEDLVARRSFRYEPAEAGDRCRLDQFLADRDLELTRSQVKRLIEEGDVRVNGAASRPAYKLRAGDEIEVVLRPAEPVETVAEAIPLDVLYEDAHLIVIDKQAGLVVHPAVGHASGTLVNALLHHCDDLAGIAGELRPGIVHRLDKDTSGVMVATKDDRTHAALSAMFKDKDVEREYLAVVAPPPRADRGTFDTLYGRHPVHRKKFSSKVERGKRAVTHWEVERRFGDRAALVRCKLETGRTHQIRVHFADHGHPLVGDPVYGRTRRTVADLARALGRQALHAARLAFVHPITGEHLAFETPLPPDIADLVAALERS